MAYATLQKVSKSFHGYAYNLKNGFDSWQIKRFMWQYTDWKGEDWRDQDKLRFVVVCKGSTPLQRMSAAVPEQAAEPDPSLSSFECLRRYPTQWLKSNLTQYLKVNLLLAYNPLIL